MVKRYFAALYVVLCVLLFAACGGKEVRNVGADDVAAAESTPFPVCNLPSPDTAFYACKVHVRCSDEGVSVSSLPRGVALEKNGKVTLLRSRAKGVEYIIGGSAEDASLTIVSEFSPLVTLDGLSLTARGRNALEISSKEAIFVRSAGGSRVSDVAGSDKADSQSAAIKLMGRAMLCGGALTVEAGRRSAIFCTDTLFLADTQLAVEAAPNNALLANNSIILSSGSVAAISGKDVVKCKNGSVVMSGGLLALSSLKDKADAIQAGSVYISGGNVSVAVSGAASDGIKAKNSLCISGGNVAVAATGGALFNAKKSDYSSASCLKSDAAIEISGGCCSFVSDGDGAKGISCDSMLVVSGGILKVVTKGGDMLHPVDLNAHSSSKGIKCDGDIFFSGGDIEVAVLGEGERSEGIEAKRQMNIGGRTKLYVYAYDDALNAAGVTISGGWVYAYSVANDAVDSNGIIEITGGTVVADGSFAPEQGVDVDDFSAFTISGGTLFSVGGSMGPFPALPMSGKNSVPVAVWSGLDAAKGSLVSLAGPDGKVLFAYKMPRSMENAAVLVASSAIRRGCEYSFALSRAIKEAEYAGNGLYNGGRVSDAVKSASFRAGGHIDCVSGDGSVTVVEPGKGMPRGMMPPPPPHFMGDSAMMGGAFPPPPPHFMGDSAMINGAFPPPPPPHVRKVRSEFGIGRLPNHDAR